MALAIGKLFFDDFKRANFPRNKKLEKLLRFFSEFLDWKSLISGPWGPEPPVHRGILYVGDEPFVPVLKSGLLGYRSEERKRRSISD